MLKKKMGKKNWIAKQASTTMISSFKFLELWLEIICYKIGGTSTFSNIGGDNLTNMLREAIVTLKQWCQRVMQVESFSHFGWIKTQNSL